MLSHVPHELCFCSKLEGKSRAQRLKRIMAKTFRLELPTHLHEATPPTQTASRRSHAADDWQRWLFVLIEFHPFSVEPVFFADAVSGHLLTILVGS